MTSPTLPATWNTMGIDAKASWLVSTHAARNYADAMSQLSRRRNQSKTRAQARAKVAPLIEGMWYNKD